jgi:stage II sporulation protein D
LCVPACDGPVPGERSSNEELALLKTPEVQVRVFEGERCQLLLPSRVAVVAAGADEVLFHGVIDRPLLEAERGGLRLGPWRGRGPVDLFLSPLSNGDESDGRDRDSSAGLGLVIDGDERRFRGSFRLSAYDGGVEVINRLSLEEYLVGVVAAEMPLSYPAAALQAQAIVARTFAVYELLWARDHGGVRPFDATTSFQVYRGVRPSEGRAVEAVVETAGEILVHDGRLFRTYFHSTCGGRTLAACRVFGDASIPPLEGTDCAACVTSAYAAWEMRLDADQLTGALRDWVHDQDVALDVVRGLELERDEDGRVQTVRVYHESGGFVMRSQRFRRLLSEAGTPFRSSSFDVQRGEAGEFVFSGQGFGHRVGMCQVGAGQKAQRDNYRQILAHYYPGSDVHILEAFY